MEKSVKYAIRYGIDILGYQEIRENQWQVVEAYFFGKDVIMYSPTGSGKGFVFEIAPCVLNYKKHGVRDNIDTVAVMVVPLLSLKGNSTLETILS